MARPKKILSPTQVELIEPTFVAIVELGGSATNDEIREKVIEMLNLSDEIVDEPHLGKGTQRTELEYQLAWARTKLKIAGAIKNSSRGVWMITAEFSDRKSVSKTEISNLLKKTNVKAKAKTATNQVPEVTDVVVDDELPEELEPWKVELAETLHSMNPYAFEKLAMLLLRECGFSQVSVTKKSGDGGIDGAGKLKINGIFSFNVAFQCKRYKGSVTASDIRDFRGSLTTDIEKGIFITTGTFTRDARKEASNAGKKQIDLIDGEEFINKLIEYRLGVKEKLVYEVDKNFFDTI